MTVLNPASATPSAESLAARLIHQWSGNLVAAKVAGTYYFGQPGTELTVGSPTLVKYKVAPDLLRLRPTDYVIAGRTAKLFLEVSVGTNAKAPTGNFTFGLYGVSAAKGAAAEWEPTFTTVLAGSEVAFVAPAASSAINKESGNITMPAEQLINLGVVTTETLVAESFVTMFGALYVIYS